jgi:hypothetical protein
MNKPRVAFRGWPTRLPRSGRRHASRHPYPDDRRRAVGWWTTTAIEAPHREPTRTVVTIEALATGTRMTTVTRFAGIEQLERVLAMGTEGGMRLSGQIDGIIANASR